MSKRDVIVLSNARRFVWDDHTIGIKIRQHRIDIIDYGLENVSGGWLGEGFHHILGGIAPVTSRSACSPYTFDSRSDNPTGRPGPDSISSTREPFEGKDVDDVPLFDR